MHWFKDVIPPRTTPQDRRYARDQREDERKLQVRRQEERERQQYLDQLNSKKYQLICYLVSSPCLHLFLFFAHDRATSEILLQQHSLITTIPIA